MVYKRSLENPLAPFFFLKKVILQDGRHASHLSIIIIIQQVPLGYSHDFFLSAAQFNFISHHEKNI